MNSPRISLHPNEQDVRRLTDQHNSLVYGEIEISRTPLTHEQLKIVMDFHQTGIQKILKDFKLETTLDWTNDYELIHAAKILAQRIRASRPRQLNSPSTFPAFSIVTPYYRHFDFFKTCARTMEQCLKRSQLKQLSLEWIILNDDPAMSDHHLRSELPESLSKVSHIIGDGENKGITARLNQGITAATGDWIVFLDCDDEIADNSLVKLNEYIHDFPNARYISSGMTDINDQGEVIRYRLRKSTASDMPRRFMIAGHLKAIRKDLFFEIGLLDSQFDGVQDFEFAIRAALHESILLVPETLYNYRWHGSTQSVSAATRQEQRARLAVIHHASTTES